MSDVEEDLARYQDFISENAGRMPEFATSSDAERELGSLNKELRSVSRGNIRKRIAAVALRNGDLEAETERISKLRSINDEASQREDAEYEEVVGEVARARRTLAELKEKCRNGKSQAEVTKRNVETAEMELELRRKQLRELKAEAKNLAIAERDAQEELRVTEAEMNTKGGTEADIAAEEEDTKRKQNQLDKYRQILKEKTAVVRERREAVANMMRQNRNIIDEFDDCMIASRSPKRAPRVSASFIAPASQESLSSDDGWSEDEKRLIEKAKAVISSPLSDDGNVRARVESSISKWST